MTDLLDQLGDPGVNGLTIAAAAVLLLAALAVPPLGMVIAGLMLTGPALLGPIQRSGLPGWDWYASLPWPRPTPLSVGLWVTVGVLASARAFGRGAR